MNKRGQTIVELMLLLSISILALSIIYSLYATQIDLSNSSRESSIAKSTINKLVNSANSLSLSGAGSTQRILIEIPTGVNVNDSNISGRMIYLKLSNGGEVFGYSDVNIVGEFKKVNGVFINEGYFVTLTFDGQKVILSYDDFELNTNGIFVSAKQGTTVEKFFTVRNNSSRDATFFVENNFSFPSFALLNISPDDVYFTLSPNETRVIDFDIELSNFSSGNYAGSINVIGEINDGVTDTNITKPVVVSIESFLNLEPVMIFPKSTSFDGVRGESTIKSFSLCNSTPSNVSFTWERNSNPDANMLEWFNWPIVDSDGVAINSVSSGDCVYFDLNFTIPLNTFGTIYDANITISYNDTNASSAYFFIDVEHIPSPYSLFFSTSNTTLPANYFLSNFVKQRNDTNYFAPTGELDWDNGTELNLYDPLFDSSLVGLWHFNNNLIDSSNISNDLGCTACPDYSSGLLESEALSFNGSDDYINRNLLSEISIDKDFSISGWFNTNSTVLGVIFENCNSASNRVGLAIRDNSGALQLGFGFYNGAAWSSKRVNISTNQWYHFVALNDGGTPRLYLNGIEAITTGGDPAVGGTSKLSIGSRAGTTYFYEGKLEEFAIWKKMLSIDEISDLYESQKGSMFDSNLIAYYKLNDKNSQGWVLNSATGIRDGQLVATADVSASGFWDTNAGYFDGAGDYIDARANPILGATPFTLSAWINTTKVNAYQGAISIGASSATNSAYIGTVGTAQTGTSNSIGGGFFGTNYGSGITTVNKWVHVALTYNGSIAKIYVDGSEKVSVNYTANLTNYNIRLGRIGSSTSYDFNGLIEEAKVFNRSLSASEIIADYNRFLNAKYVDGNIVDATVSSDWNSIKINQDINYNFGKEISLGEKFFDVNLIGLWHFNDKNSDDWILNSARGILDANLNNGANINGVGLWDTNSLYLDGVNDYVAIPSASNLYIGASKNFTVSAWVNPTSISSTRSIFVYGASAVCFNYGMVLVSGKLAFRNSSYDYSIGESLVEVNKWNHLVLTSVGSSVLGYINGQYIGTVNYSSSACGTSQAVIGVRAMNSITAPFVGKIDEVAIWNRNLSQSEVIDLYRKGVSRLDLDVYSCSNVICSTKTGSQYISDANNGVWMDLNSDIVNSRYLGFDAYFKKARGFEDYNASTFYVGSFINDFNASFIK